MASLTKRCRHPRAEWEYCACQWLIRRQQAGRTIYTPVGPDRKAAERALAGLESDASETVAQAVDAWLAAKERDPNARPNSLASYRARAKVVTAQLGRNRVKDLRPEHLTRFVDQTLATGRKPATVQGIYACLTSVLRHAQRRGVIRHLPVPPEGPGIPATQARVQALSLAEIEDVIAHMPGTWGKVAELILLTGLRWGEAVAIEPGDIEGHVVRIRRTRNRYGGVNPPKTNRGARLVPVSPRALELLGELRLPVGGDYRRAREALVAALGELHRPGMGWHTLRAAHATLLEAAGVTLRDQASRMGHGTNYSQTLSYGLVSQAGDASQLDAARQHVAPSSGEPGQVVPLAKARRRRRRAP